MASSVFHLVVTLSAGLGLIVHASNTTGFLSIPPSLYWDGADGLWSTFQIQIGTPPQTVRLLPGTSSNAGNSIWVVISQGCGTLNPNISNCANDRGYLFQSNASSSWSTERLSNGGLYQLATYEESLLGLSGNAYYGFDTVNLGLSGSNLPTLASQLIAGYATNDFWLGSLGLSPYPFNFTNLDTPLPSMLSSLRNQSYIAGTSWAYTAGAHYQDPPVFGSLTLGGYDNARFNFSNALNSVPFGADFTRDLVIGIQSITYDTLGSSPLLTMGIYAYIDSMVTQMWLPTGVCQAFEQAFNLTWNAAAELYILTADQHNALLAQNPAITLTLGAEASSGGQTIDITLPYAAFDLNISQPYVGETSHYFPLKQAQNNTQYTLGRVFLQEAYVVADYDRQEFHLAQALFPSTEAAQQLQALEPPNSTTSGGNSSISNGGSVQNVSVSLTAGAIVGIVVGAVALMALVAGAFFCMRRRKRQQPSVQGQGQKQDQDQDQEYREDRKEGISELPPGHLTPQLEMGADDAAVYEIGSRQPRLTELGGKPKAIGHELSGEPAAVEKDAYVQVSELQGSGGEPVELPALKYDIRKPSVSDGGQT